MCQFGGPIFGGLFSAGGMAGSFERNGVGSLGASYNHGPLFLGVAYLDARDPNFSSYCNNTASSTTASNMAAYRIFSGYASGRSNETFAAAADRIAGASFAPAASRRTAVVSRARRLEPFFSAFLCVGIDAHQRAQSTAALYLAISPDCELPLCPEP